MTIKEFLLLLDNLFELEPGTVKGNEGLDSFEAWDSLGIISFMALVDEHFSVGLQATQLAESKTVTDLIGLLGERITKDVCANANEVRR
jgi:acyl carrier protein